MKYLKIQLLWPQLLENQLKESFKRDHTPLMKYEQFIILLVFNRIKF